MGSLVKFWLLNNKFTLSKRKIEEKEISCRIRFCFTSAVGTHDPLAPIGKIWLLSNLRNAGNYCLLSAARSFTRSSCRTVALRKRNCWQIGKVQCHPLLKLYIYCAEKFADGLDLFLHIFTCFWVGKEVRNNFKKYKTEPKKRFHVQMWILRPKNKT